MLRKTAIVLLSLLLSLAIALWLGSREAALVWVVNHAAQRSAGQFAASGISGSLLYGPIGFTRIEYHPPGMQLIAEKGRIELARWPLLSGVVLVPMAQADFITIAQSPVQHPVPAKPPERVSLSVRLTVNELRINRVALAQGGARRPHYLLTMKWSKMDLGRPHLSLS
jgi:autotransporter translocation and assembly factor TamB